MRSDTARLIKVFADALNGELRFIKKLHGSLTIPQMKPYSCRWKPASLTSNSWQQLMILLDELKEGQIGLRQDIW